MGKRQRACQEATLPPSVSQGALVFQEIIGPGGREWLALVPRSFFLLTLSPKFAMRVSHRQRDLPRKETRSMQINAGALALPIVVLTVLAFPQPSVADPPTEATVQFGQEHVADGIPPVGHPGSSAHHAVDSLVPRTVVIAAGGTVTFELPVGSVHQVAIYEDGTTPEDIDVSAVVPQGAGCPPVPLINDGVGRIALLGAQPCAGGPTEVSYTFNAPGRYLVICTFLPHLTDTDMYGWVIVE